VFRLLLGAWLAEPIPTALAQSVPPAATSQQQTLHESVESAGDSAVGVGRQAQAGQGRTNVEPFDLRDFEFMERQYVFWSPQKIVTDGRAASLALEAHVGPHVPLAGWADHADPLRTWSNQLRLLFTFQSDFRMTTASSAPVVTPSYHAQFRLQWLRRHVFTSSEISRAPPFRDLRWGLTMDLFSHHSNGQDGCTFFDASGACASRGEGATRLNEKNGSFGTNYLGISGHVRHSWGASYSQQKSSLLGSAGLQYHHGVPFGGLSDTREDGLLKLWGRVHAFVEAEARYGVEEPCLPSGYSYFRFRSDIASGGTDPLLPSVRARPDTETWELGYISRGLKGFGLFARVVTGREYYNIEFTQSVTRLQFGVVLDTSGSVPILNGGGGEAQKPPPGDDPKPSRAGQPPPAATPTLTAPYAPNGAT